MTTTHPDAPGVTDTPAPAGLRVDTEPGTRRPLMLLGGFALAVAPLLVIGGSVTSPPQASDAPADYIASLAADPFLTNTSATLFHYGWIAMGLGILAALGLLRGSRGRTLALIGGLGSAFGAFQISGLLLSDWFLSGLGRTVSEADGVAVFDSLGQSSSFTIWMASAKLGVIALPVVFYAGLARAGVIGWKLVPLAVLPMVAGGMIGGLLPGVWGSLAGVLVTAVGYLPTFVTAYRLVRRSRLT